MATEGKTATQRRFIFFVQILWLLVLGILAWLYFNTQVFEDHQALGSIPLGVVWFGALGAVLLSLNGIIDHAHDWDPGHDLWHLSRPIMGAALAVVGVIMLQAGILAVGAAPNDPAIPKNLLYYLFAFLIGYREETFRELVKRLVDVILAPAVAKSAPSIEKLEQPSSKDGKTRVDIRGSGLTETTSVTFGDRTTEFHVESDTRVTAELPEPEVPGPVTVTLKTPGGTATCPFSYPDKKAA